MMEFLFHFISCNFRNKDKPKPSGSLSLKRKHDQEDQPKKRGRRKIESKLDIPRQTLSVTPVLPVFIVFLILNYHKWISNLRC